jgi:6-methylsalicylate decarboxylase
MGARVDIHQHLWTEPLLGALAARSRAPRVRRSGDHWILQLEGEPDSSLPGSAPELRARAALVAADGLDRALVAPSCPLGVEALPRDEAEPLLEAYAAGVAALGPEFGWWAAVALDEPEPAEVDAALDAGAAGLCLPASALGSFAGVARCSSLLERLSERGAPLLVHPGPAPWQSPLHAACAPDWWPGLTSYVAQMNAAWHAFVAVGRPAFPALKVVFAMLAGLAPLHTERLAARGGPAGRAVDRLTFYDTSSYGPRAIDAMIRVVGVDQLVNGSDRPVVEPADLSSLGDAVAVSLRERNVERLLGGVTA